jgi:RNA polymerase sigma-70 factor (ECF subfamily)
MPLSETERDAQLLEDFLCGRDAAFDPIYESYNQKLFAFISRMIFDEDAAKDIAHQVWEKVILQRANADRERVQNVGGYLITLARNLALDHLRKTKKYAGLESAETLAAHEAGDDRALVIEALKQLPEETREILVLNYYCGFSFEEIAEMLGKKPNAIWTRASRARARLKDILERIMKVEKSGR